MRTLRVISGPAAGESLGVEKEVVIGREGADLNIADPQISRRHTIVRPVDQGIEVEDLGSLNGTFVNDERVGAPVTLTSPGKIRVGDSEIEVELALDGLTRVAPSPAAAGAADPPAADTAAPSPGRGSVRRVEEESPLATGAPAARPAAPPKVEPPPRRPPPPPPRPPAPSAGPQADRRRPLWAPALGALVLAGVVAAVLVVTLSDDNGVETRPLIASMRTADLVQGKTAITFAGTVNQTPGGEGTVIGRLKLKGDVTKGKVVELTGTMVFRFDNGRIDATVTGTAKERKDKTTDLVITGKIVRGTREFEGAKGSFKMKSGQETATVPKVGISSLDGTIKY